MLNKLKKAKSMIGDDINLSLSEFNECFKYAGECMVAHFVVGKDKTNTWFDKESETLEHLSEKVCEK